MKAENASEAIAAALEIANLKITKLDMTKVKCVFLQGVQPLPIDKFCSKFLERLGVQGLKHKEVYELCHNHDDMIEHLVTYCRDMAVSVREKKEVVVEIPEHYKELKLNIDESHGGRDIKFFMTTPNETVSSVAGSVWLRVCGIPEEEAVAMARKVVPEYKPRSKPGIVSKINVNEEMVGIFNNYIPPAWKKHRDEVPAQLPKLFERLVNHLFPLPVEREYFYSWLHDSLYNRSFVYLILCGHGGIGKNVLKKVMRALHGHQNTVDGKRSTLVERFNSQLAESTLAWFDELTYDIDTENVMKEIQNDTISIERKGVDATRATKIHASLVVSNNKPRDNYIAFDARKFAPLVLTSKRLELSMTTIEIDTLVKKVEDWSSKTFDPKFLAQIAVWLKKNGRAKRWPTLEYKGPMFYKLAHTSMSRWQKRAAQLIIDSKPGGRAIHDAEKGFLWSSVADGYQKKSPDRSLQFPDYSTVKYFFDIFVDADGKKAFETKLVPKNLMADFWVKLLKKDMHLMTEAEVAREMGGKYVVEKDVEEGKYEKAESKNSKVKTDAGKKKVQGTKRKALPGL